MVPLVEMTKLLGDAGLTLATEILLVQGRLRYVNDWDTEITERLKRRAGSEAVVMRRHANTGIKVPHRLVIEDKPAGVTRRFDYAGCKAKAPLLYHSHVTVTAAPSPLTLTFAKAEIWDSIKSAGWQSFAQGYAGRRATGEVWGFGDQAERLSEVRSLRSSLKSREQILRLELAELIIEKDTSCRPYTHGGGILRVRESSPLQKVDLDLAEKHPELRKFLTTSPRAAYTRVEFRPVEPSFEDDRPDDDEDVRGIWK